MRTFQQYREQGFLAIENVFTAEEVASGKAGLTHLIKGGNPEFKGVQFEGSYKADQFTNDEERKAHVRKCMTFVEYESRLRAVLPAALARDRPQARGIGHHDDPGHGAAEARATSAAKSRGTRTPRTFYTNRWT